MKKATKWFAGFLLAIFVLLNVVAYNQAFHFSHFFDRTTEFEEQSDFVKAIFGERQYKRTHSASSEYNIEYKSVTIEGDVTLKANYFQAQHPKAFVLLFHGYGSNKESNTLNGDFLRSIGFSAIAVDLRAHGQSAGNKCTLGVLESNDVAATYKLAHRLNPDVPIFILGQSMGAATVMRAMHDHNLEVAGLIIECPFATTREALAGRFREMNLPVFPLGDLILVHAGIQHGFNAFGHNPEAYAKEIDAPVLLVWGRYDHRVMQDETDRIFANLKGEKELVILENTGHGAYHRSQDFDTWKIETEDFLLSTLQ